MNRISLKFYNKIFTINKLNYSLSLQKFKNNNIFIEPNEPIKPIKHHIANHQQLKIDQKVPIYTREKKTQSPEIDKGDDWLSKLSITKSSVTNKDANGCGETFHQKTKYPDLSIEEKKAVIKNFIEDRQEEIPQKFLDKNLELFLNAKSFTQLRGHIK